MTDRHPRVELIAHRAGNRTSTVGPAAAVADTIELDVHQFRGRLEVRHAKVIWPTPVLWEKWELVPRDAPPPLLADILGVVPDGTTVWLDLKSSAPRFTRRVLAAIGDRADVTVSSRQWWNLRRFRRAGGIRTMRSAGPRWQRWTLRWIRRFGPDDGVVVPERFVTPTAIAGWLGRTSHVAVWAVADLDRASELVGLGVTGLIVDDLDLIAAIDRRERSL